MKNEKLLIIGAGLSGSLLGIRLADLGYDVEIIEKRSDLRSTDISAGRSINLALSDRGLAALKLAKIDAQIEELLIPMHGRMLHNSDGMTRFSPYSGRDHDYINSVSRGGLNSILLDKAESFKNLKIKFNHTCQKVYLAENKALVMDQDGNETWIYADIIFGADGAGSIVRKSMRKIANKRNLAFQDNSEFLTHGYKELSFPPHVDNNWQIDSNSLHIWPRGDYMMIALPNLDKSFTVTLFLPYSGTNYSFDHIDKLDNKLDFIVEHFPDAENLFGDINKEYEENPVGRLGTVFCQPWSLTRKSCLIGDAAHAIVPFYGQGMNCAFEDVLILDKLIKEYKGHWPSILEIFSSERKNDADAIAELAIDNFYEMRDHVSKDLFAKKRKIEIQLEKQYKNYYSKYSLVTFREDIPYSFAKKQGRFQDKFIISLIQEQPQINADEVYLRLQKEFEKHSEFSLTEHA